MHEYGRRDLKLSDHRPVYGIYEVRVKTVLLSKKAEIEKAMYDGLESTVERVIAKEEKAVEILKATSTEIAEQHPVVKEMQGIPQKPLTVTNLIEISNPHEESKDQDTNPTTKEHFFGIVYV